MHSDPALLHPLSAILCVCSKNPGIICSDPSRSAELRWVTGMFHWVQTVQRNREYDYFPTLIDYVDKADYKNDFSFIGMVNAMLGGKDEDIERRTKVFFDAMRAFNLITVETNSTYTSEGDAPANRHCGVDWDDAASNCDKPCETNMDCTGLELCHAGVAACNVTKEEDVTLLDTEEESPVGSGTNTTEEGADFNNTDADGDPLEVDDGVSVETDGVDTQPVGMTAMSQIAATTNYCGVSWGDAATNCAVHPICPGGTDAECPPGHSCFMDVFCSM